MKHVDVKHAQARLSELVDLAFSGEDVVVSRDGKPLVRITRLGAGPRVKFGLLKGRFEVPEDFDNPLPQDVVARFGGR